MKKLTMLGTLLAAVAISGCSVQSAELTAKDLQHHRFELLTLDGTPVIAQHGGKPSIEFGEKMHVSGAMCNRFMGQGQLENNLLTVKQLASTQMMCSDPLLNKGDQLIGAMLQKGVNVSLQSNQLTLTEGPHVLVYRAKEWVN